ncbi:MAG: hypothetical protein ACOY0T_08375 [Myxococcota bacterium]
MRINCPLLRRDSAGWLLGFVCAVTWLAPAQASAQTEAEVTRPQAYEDHGFIEPCSVANYQEMFTECELCPASQAAPRACSDRLGRAGYQKKCQTRVGHAGWGEVWCISKNPNQPQVVHSAPISFFVGIAGVLALLGAYFYSRRTAPKPRAR